MSSVYPISPDVENQYAKLGSRRYPEHGRIDKDAREKAYREYLLIPEPWKCDHLGAAGITEDDDEVWDWRRIPARAYPCAPPQTNNRVHVDQSTEILFRELASKWREETRLSSSILNKVMNLSYQRIIGLGQKVVPLILKDLQQKPEHWFWALTAITGENPIAEEDEGNIRKMTESWLRFGKERGWIEEDA